MNDFSDEELLGRFNDASCRYDAFSEMVARYSERLYWHIRKLVVVHEDADDTLQNTFLKAWRGLDSFRGEAKLSTWLYRIATNESMNCLNRRRSSLMLPLEDADEMLAQRLHHDAYFTGDELQIRLQEAILALPEKQRIVFNMRYFDEMPYEEMSAILGTSAGALKASYHHAVGKIKSRFELDG